MITPSLFLDLNLQLPQIPYKPTMLILRNNGRVRNFDTGTNIVKIYILYMSNEINGWSFDVHEASHDW